MSRQILAVAYREKREYKKYTEEMRLIFKAEPTLYNMMQTFIAYQKRYALILSLIVLMALFSALLIRSRIFLIVPTVLVIQGLIADFKFIIDGLWKRKLRNLLFSLITDCILAIVTYAIYIALSPK